MNPYTFVFVQLSLIFCTVLKKTEESISIFVYRKKNMRSTVGGASIYKWIYILKYFILNILKTQILSFNFNPSNSMKSRFQLQHKAESMRYLELNIPKELTKLFSINFPLLNQKIRGNVRRGELIPLLSFGSWTESVKINVLLRLLYLFQSH